MVRISNIKIEISKIVDLNTEKQALQQAILSKLKISKHELLGFEIFKKSVDARKKDAIVYVYTVDVKLKNEKTILEKYSNKGITAAPEEVYEKVPLGSEKLTERPVIIGMGPAGLFAGLLLARNGYKPIILERGEDVDTRTRKINNFWTNGVLDTESNVQFGEGGAGTFSDGKLTTLINDKRSRMILKEFVKAGAPQEILYMSKPHIGTDLLKTAVKNIRQEIIEHGGEVRFKAKVTDFVIDDGCIKGLVINGEQRLNCHVVLLAIGHSARDTFEVLYNRGVNMIKKPFSIGVRIEHPQHIIDKAQYGKAAGHPGLGAADYKLVYHAKSGRSAYTFCMCPGGYVVAAASEEGCVVTNGMSEHKRDGENANSALLVGVTPDDFPGEHPLAGVEFQRKWERLAYQLGGSCYKAPVQLTGDFLADRVSSSWGRVKPTYKPGVVFANLKDCLPDYVIETLREAILYFDTKIKGFAMPDSILTGVETRSSSPVRITRDDEGQSNIKGLYPMGEGAGYAGGIMSSAVDGIKTAEQIMRRYAPLI
ncbi:MAG: NAD(P)/FAD-dependent oxidoreductase [Clostridiaceae bacterium]|nr:NAD(P)/FAD-dependent oxidoreductase [Clostridiaceae bacterium]